MILIACPACAREISPNARACPGCGEPIKKGAGDYFTGEVKSRYMAAALAIVLGSFGIHRFYLNRHISGVVYLLLCWTGIPALLGVIEGILYLCHSEKRFQEVFVAKRK